MGKIKSIDWTPFLISIAAFAYLAFMSAKQWTWVFASGDSGDWLAAATVWMAPQPYGSPLYILLGHFLNWFPGDLVLKMTILLSALPAAVTIAFVYKAIQTVGGTKRLALLGSTILLACGIFLSQSTVLEEYALTTMFVTIAFYCYLKDKRMLVALFLGLATSVHIIAAPIAVLWLVVNFKEWKSWVKPVLAVYLPIVVIAYSFILLLMAMDTPKLISGGLSLQSINAYLGSTATIGSLSLVETPKRLLQAGEILLLSFGVSLIPLYFGLRKPWNKVTRMAIITIGFCAWLYLTNSDQTTWTFLIFSLPIACIVIVFGLSRMPSWSTKATALCAVVLIALNAVFLNANILTLGNPETMEYYNSIQELPDNSAVALSRGGPYGLGMMYRVVDGETITPLFLQKEEGWDNASYLDYIKWIQTHYNNPGSNWIEQVNYSLENNQPVFTTYDILPPEWQERIDAQFTTEKINLYFRKITSAKSYNTSVQSLDQNLVEVNSK